MLLRQSTVRERAFTLLELIVVIVILGILAALAVPTFKTVQDRSKDEVTLSGLEALSREAQALYAFEDVTWEEAMTQAAADMPATASMSTGTFAATPKLLGLTKDIMPSAIGPDKYDQVAYQFSGDSVNVIVARYSPTDNICFALFTRSALTLSKCASVPVLGGAGVHDTAVKVITVPGGFTSPTGPGGGTPPPALLPPRVVGGLNFSQEIIMPSPNDPHNAHAVRFYVGDVPTVPDYPGHPSGANRPSSYVITPYVDGVAGTPLYIQDAAASDKGCRYDITGTYTPSGGTYCQLVFNAYEPGKVMSFVVTLSTMGVPGYPSQEFKQASGVPYTVANVRALPVYVEPGGLDN